MARIIYIFLFLSITFANPHIQGQERMLYGKVKLITSNGTNVLASAKTILIGTKDTLVAYTDNSGNFAFYELKETNYTLQILLNTDTLFFQNGNTLKKFKKITFSGNVKNIGVVNVKKK